MRDYTLVKEQIREAIDVVALLEHYGARVNERNIRYDRVRSNCPIHNGRGEINFSFDLNTKLFTCFSHHCGEDLNQSPLNQPIRDVYYFIQLCEEKRTGRHCSFMKALQIASDLTGIPITEENTNVSKEIRDRLEVEKYIKHQKRANKKVEFDILDEAIIEKYRGQVHPYLIERHFPMAIIEEFELGYSPIGIEEDSVCHNKDFPGRIIVPIRNDKGELVGLSGRLATDNKKLIEKYRKYKNKVDFDKGFVLYNLNKAKEHIAEDGQVVIVEGFFDVLRLWSYGIQNVVAIMGSALVPEQMLLLLSSGCFEAYVCMDNDGAGQIGEKRIGEQLYNASIDTYIMKLPPKKDPDNITSLEFWLSYSEAEKYISKLNANSLTNKRKFAII